MTLGAATFRDHGSSDLPGTSAVAGPTDVRAASSATQAAGDSEPWVSAITTDDRLLDHILDAAAIAGVPVRTAVDLRSGAHAGAALLLIGIDSAGHCRHAPPAVLSRSVLVAHSGDGERWAWAQRLGVANLVDLPEAAGWLSERLLDLRESLTASGRATAVIPAGGGAGASTLAAALARAGARLHGSSLLVDADPGGPGCHHLLGCSEDAPALDWHHFTDLRGRLPSDELQRLPCCDSVQYLAWPPGPARAPQQWHAALGHVVAAGIRSHPWTIVDLGRDQAGAIETLPAPNCEVIVVAEARLRCAAAAGHLREHLETIWPGEVRLLVRDCGGTMSPDDVARIAGLPLLGEIPHERRVADDADLGRPPGSRRRSWFTREAGRLLRAVPGRTRPSS